MKALAFGSASKELDEQRGLAPLPFTQLIEMLAIRQYFYKPMWLAGILLIGLGVFHIPIQFLDGSDWEGAVSWRKPILFGISTGLTLCSLGWLADHLKREHGRKWRDVLAWVTSVSLVAEVGLITLQRWRGTASHFNQSTPIDSAIDVAMIVLIVVAVIGIIYFWIRTFETLDLRDDLALAARSGMLFLVISCAIGFVISAWGYHRVSMGLDPGKVGQSGITKFPHGVTIHALQILPAMVWILQFLEVRIARRKLSVWLLSVSFFIQFLFASYQTLNGYGRFELASFTSMALAAITISFTAASIAVIGSLAISGSTTKRSVEEKSTQ